MSHSTLVRRSLITYLCLTLVLLAPIQASAALDAQYYAYKKAADKAEESADVNDTLWKVWAGVGAVCTAVCATSLGGSTIVGPATDPWICSGSTLAASITDAAMTKEMTTALMGIVSVGASVAIAPSIPEVKPGQPTPKPPKNWGACIQAATAVIQVFIKRNSMEEQKKAAKENRKYAEQLAAESGSQTVVASTGGSIITTPNGSAGAGVPQPGPNNSGPGLTTVSDPHTKDSKLSLSNCSNTKGSGDVQQSVFCATSFDKNLPDFVKSPKFKKDFKNVSGKDLKDFLKTDSPSGNEGVTSAFGGVLNPSQSSKLTAMLDRFQKRHEGAWGVEGTAYAGGGGGGGASSGPQKAEVDPSAMIGSLIEQFMPKDAVQTGAKLDRVAAANLTRSPASISEDPRLGLFERVSFRYQVVVRRILLH